MFELWFFSIPSSYFVFHLNNRIKKEVGFQIFNFQIFRQKRRNRQVPLNKGVLIVIDLKKQKGGGCLNDGFLWFFWSKMAKNKLTNKCVFLLKTITDTHIYTIQITLHYLSLKHKHTIPISHTHAHTELLTVGFLKNVEFWKTTFDCKRFEKDFFHNLAEASLISWCFFFFLFTFEQNF